jgi:long-chain acyl-CoA synthetase
VPHQEFLKRFARQHQCAADLAQLAEHPGLKAAIGEAVKRANRILSPIERVRRFHIMPEMFGIENGLLTPTLKLRRPLIVKAYRELLESLYAPAK